LGVPCGSNEYIEKELLAKIEIWKKELDIIFNLNDLQIKFYLLYKYQNISKINYILRNAPINFEGELYKQLKNIKKLILRAMIPFSLNQQQIQQSELATRYGGIACRNIKQLICTAYLSRVSTTNQNIKR